MGPFLTWWSQTSKYAAMTAIFILVKIPDFSDIATEKLKIVHYSNRLERKPRTSCPLKVLIRFVLIVNYFHLPPFLVMFSVKDFSRCFKHKAGPHLRAIMFWRVVNHTLYTFMFEELILCSTPHFTILMITDEILQTLNRMNICTTSDEVSQIFTSTPGSIYFTVRYKTKKSLSKIRNVEQDINLI